MTNPMTNPLEQIRDLAESWRGAYHSVTERDLGNRDGLIHCSDRILAILAASQDYVCVPVEPTEGMKIAALNELHPLGRLVDWHGMDTLTREDVTECYKAMLAASKENGM